MIREPIQIRCEKCGQLYPIKNEANHAKLVRIIDFAVCPCGHPHRPLLYERHKNSWKCEGCHVPEPWVTRKNKKICESCYFSRYLERRKVVKQREMIKL